MAYSVWVASTAYVVGDIRRATTLQTSGLVFRCTTTGTTAATEPAWPTDIGSTVVDNTVVWTAISSVYEDLAVLAPSAIIELFELTLDPTLHGSSDVYRFHAGCNASVTGNIIWNGNPYSRLPIKAEGFEFSSAGSLPRPTLTVANLDGGITAVLLTVNATTPGNDLIGAKLKRIRTLKKYLDGETAADPHAKFPDEIWFIDRKSAENRDVVQFELASKLDMAGVMLPRRQLVSNICQWQYKSTECGYTPVASFTGTYNLRALAAQYSMTGTTITINSTAHGYVAGDKAWFNFLQLSGTYSWTATTITVTSNNHGYANGDRAYFAFTSGSATSGYYTISSATTNTFVITSATSSPSTISGYPPVITYTTVTGNVTINGDATSGYYTITTAAANSFTITSGASGSGTTVCKMNSYLLKVAATAHGLSVSDTVNLDFTSGTATDGRFVVNVANANNFCLEIKTGSTTSGNVTATQWYTTNNAPTTTLANDICKKTLAACKLRFGDNAELPYGSFPGVGFGA